jgi:hypothetical protein
LGNICDKIDNVSYHLNFNVSLGTNDILWRTLNDTAQQRGNITETNNNIIDLGMKHFIHKMKKIRYNTLYFRCMHVIQREPAWTDTLNIIRRECVIYGPSRSKFN